MTRTALHEDHALEPEATTPAAVASEPPGRDGTPFVSAGHELLFALEADRCDACDAPVGSGVHEDDEGGHGLYIWARHGETIYEEPPLCASCAAAITITALQRWEIEEEEG